MEENKQFKQYLSKAMFWCSKSEKSTGDVLQKLSDWNVPQHFYEPIVEQLKAESFVNNERFAIAFTNDKFKFNKWGKVKIKHALQQKMVNNDTIMLALKQVDDEYYRSIAKELLRNKIDRTKDPDKFKLKQKVLRFMASRGFESEIVFDLWEEIEN